MRASLARAFQVLGLVLLPVGLYYGLAREDTRTELTLLGIGATLFLLGKLVLEPKR